MFNLVKYELKGNYKFVLGNILMVILLNLLLMTRKGIWSTEIIIVLSAIIFITSAVIIFLEGIKLMSRYMKGDEGYLLLTLPQKGHSILTSRLISALIEIAFVSSIGFAFLWINMSSIDFIREKFMRGMDAKVILNGIAGSAANIILMLTLIYFSVVISKVAFKNRKLGGVGAFLIFLVASFLINYVAYSVSNLFNVSINYGELYANVRINTSLLGEQGGLVVTTAQINIPSLIYNLVIFVGLFAGTSYMLERKVDL